MERKKERKKERRIERTIVNERKEKPFILIYVLSSGRKKKHGFGWEKKRVVFRGEEKPLILIYIFCLEVGKEKPFLLIYVLFRQGKERKNHFF